MTQQPSAAMPVDSVAAKTVAAVVGRTLAGLGVRRVFGVVGSGNFHVTNALIAAGARFVAARHEGGATTMADAYTRVSGEPAVVTVHQGCGLTNAMTGLAEAAKSRTPLLVLAAEADSPTSNFAVGQAALAEAVGAEAHRVRSAETAEADTRRAWEAAVNGRRTVLVNLPLGVQAMTIQERTEPGAPGRSDPGGPAGRPAPADESPAPPDDSPAAKAPAVEPDRGQVDDLVRWLSAAERPVFLAGRGARLAGARPALEALAEASGALLATSAVAKGFFRGHPWALDVSGGFATPAVAALIGGADLVVAWGCSLTMWTTRHGRLIAPGARVAQVDDDPAALGRQRTVDLPLLGDVRETAERALAGWNRPSRTGYRTAGTAATLDRGRRWRDVPFDDRSTTDRIDPRVLTIGLDDLLPTERVVAVDSGNFMGYPSMFLEVPDDDGFCFTQSFQSIGLGLATAIGAALARPDRLTVAALGDGGALMSVCELDTLVRLGLPMLVVVYNDEAYGAEVHHFGPGGFDLGTVRFPETDIAAIARGFGCEAVTVRRPADLAAVQRWVSGARERPLVVDAKVTTDEPSWWLEEAFRGH